MKQFFSSIFFTFIIFFGSYTHAAESKKKAAKTAEENLSQEDINKRFSDEELLDFIEQAQEAKENPINHALSLEEDTIPFTLQLIEARPDFLIRENNAKPLDEYPAFFVLKHYNEFKKEDVNTIIKAMLKKKPSIARLQRQNQPFSQNKFSDDSSLNSTLLHVVVKLEDPELIKTVLKAHPNMNAEDKNEVIPLFYAEDLNIFNLVLNNTVKIDRPFSILGHAMARYQNNGSEKIDALLRAGIDLHCAVSQIMRPRRIMFSENFAQALAQVLNSQVLKNNLNLKNALVNTPDRHTGLLPLCEAAKMGWEKEAIVLIEHGANCVDPQYKDFIVPLILKFENNEKRKYERKTQLQQQTTFPDAVSDLVEEFFTLKKKKSKKSLLNPYLPRQRQK